MCSKRMKFQTKPARRRDGQDLSRRNDFQMYLHFLRDTFPNENFHVQSIVIRFGELSYELYPIALQFYVSSKYSTRKKKVLCTKVHLNN